MGLCPAIASRVRFECVTKSNEEIGKEVPHPLSVERELGSQTYQSRYEASPWADAYRKIQVAQSVQGFEQGDFSSKDESSPGRSLLSLSQLSPDSSRTIHSQLHELLQPTSELLAIR
jgi:hypothetical protein